jgi:hypothetical protein
MFSTLKDLWNILSPFSLSAKATGRKTLFFLSLVFAYCHEAKMTIVDRIIHTDVLSKAKVKASHAAWKRCLSEPKGYTTMPELLEEAPATVTPKRQPRAKREPKKPSVEVFKEIVMRHCGYMNVANVDGLCGPQTEALIEELAQHFGWSPGVSGYSGEHIA